MVTMHVARLRSLPVPAAVLVLTVVAYLFLTAMPAMATSCTLDAGTDTLTVDVTTDDRAVLAIDDGTYGIGANRIALSVNGGDFGDCAGALADNSTDLINVNGSNAGNETITFAEADDDPGPKPFTWPADTINGDVNITVNLGNGSDAVVFEYAAMQVGPTDAIADAGTNALQIGSTAAGDFVTQDFDADADVKIVDAENLTFNLGDGNDTIDQDSDAFPFSPFADFTTNTPNNNPFQRAFTANGGAGDDYVDSGLANDTFNGGSGDDEISFEFATGTGATVDLGTGAVSGGAGTDTLTDVQDILGSHLDDVLVGNSLDNDIDAMDGNDVIDGVGGNDGANPDTQHSNDGLVGGPGDDVVTGGLGNDIVNGDGPSLQAGPDGNDVVDEGAAPNGADVLTGEGGCDEIDYGARTGAVTIDEIANTGWGETGEGDAGNDFETLVTGSGNDTIVGDTTPETAQPGAGDDTIDLDGQIGLSDCGLALDFLDLSDAAGAVTFDLINGTATGNGTDSFSNVEGYLSGGGDDTLLLGDASANGNLLGEWSSDGGIDTVDASAATTNLFIDLSALGFDCSPDPLIGCLEVENATGGTGNDAIVGNGLANTLIGGDGADDIVGLNGNDTVEGGQGNDVLSGDNGADTLLFIHAPSGEDIDTQLGFASGGDGEDTILFFEIVKGSDFADTINAGQTAFSLNNRIFGRGGEDNIVGSNSADLLVGGGADDTIRAGKGDDTLKGNAGNDFLVGGGGFDIGFGGKGKDDCRKIEQKHSC